MADVQIAIIDQQNTQIALAAPSETQVNAAVPGVQGPAGEGVPQGGTANQVLFKQSGTDYDTAWSEVTSAMIGDLEITNADVAANAEIAVSKLADGAARQLLQTDAAGTGVEWTSNVDVPGTLDVTGAATFDSTVTVGGNNVITAGDTGTVTSTMILDGTIVNGDVNASAAIAGTKISPDFGSQNVVTTGTSTAASFIPTSSTVPTNGVYLPSANNVAISTNGTGRLFVDASGEVGIGTANPNRFLTINDASQPDLALSVGDVEKLRLQSTSSENYVDLVGQDLVLRGGPTGGGERLRITTAGLVGIGTSDPGSYLAGSNQLVVGSASTGAGITIFTPDTSAGSLTFAEGTGAADNARGSIKYFHNATGANGYMQFFVNTVSQMTIKTTGVGIGTSTPSFGVGDGLEVARSGVATVRVSSNTQGVELRSDGGTGTLETRGAFPLLFGIQGTERARIDSSGRLLVGTSSARSNFFNTTFSSLLQIEGASLNPAEPNSRFVSQTYGQNSADDPGYIFAKHRGTNVGDNTVVIADDNLGLISFQGSDGNQFVNAAEIRGAVDGTPGANDMPGRLVFTTTADGASSPTERMRIDNTGFISLGGDTNTGFSNPSADNLAITTGGSERARIDSSGRLLVGTSSARTGFGSVQLEGTAYNSISCVNNTNDTGSSSLVFGKSRGTAVGSNTIVQSGDVLGSVIFQGADGTDIRTRAAAIYGMVDGTPGADDMPGRLVFSTTADGASSPTERMRIDSSGRVGVGTTNPGQRLHVVASGTTVSSEFETTTSTDCFVTLTNTSGSAGIGSRSDDLAFLPAGSEKARIDSSGRLLVGISSARSDFFTNAPDVQIEKITDRARLMLCSDLNTTQASELILSKTRGTTAGSATIVQQNDELGIIHFAGADGTDFAIGASIKAEVDGAPGANDMPGRLVFSTTADGASSPTERMRITRRGEVYIGVGSPGSDSLLSVQTNSNPSAIFDRKVSDGDLVLFRQEGTQEGSISVSGTTVSYNGAHLSRWSQLPGIDPHDKDARPEILRGTVMSNLDEMCDWIDPESGDAQDNEQLNKTKISDVEGDKNVAGIFQSWDDDDDTWVNDYYLAMTGDFIIRIGAGVTVERGDLLMSAGDGTAKPQDDDIIRSKTIAKVTSTNVSCTHPDGSYCVPCVLMAC